MIARRTNYAAPAVDDVVSEQIRWWKTRGVTAADVATSMGWKSRRSWAEIRARMERWMRERGAR